MVNRWMLKRSARLSAADGVEVNSHPHPLQDPAGGTGMDRGGCRLRTMEDGSRVNQAAYIPGALLCLLLVGCAGAPPQEPPQVETQSAPAPVDQPPVGVIEKTPPVDAAEPDSAPVPPAAPAEDEPAAPVVPAAPATTAPHAAPRDARCTRRRQARASGGNRRRASDTGARRIRHPGTGRTSNGEATACCAKSVCARATGTQNRLGIRSRQGAGTIARSRVPRDAAA